MEAIFCGLTTLDITQFVSQVPHANEKVVSHATELDVGGPAANAARVAHALGVSAQLVTLLGNSPAAQLAAKTLHSEGLTVIDLARDDQFPISTVLVDDDGARAVASRNNPNRDQRLPHTELLHGARALEVDGHALAAQILLARQAKAMGIPVILDGGSYKPGIEELLPYISHALVSADFAVPGQSDVFSTLVAYHIPWIAQSHGADPVQVHSSTGSYQVPVPDVPVRDTLGAGDVLHGAFTAALAQGKNEKLALQFAVRIAARSVTHRGILGFLQ
ncbi:MAG: PfkB family carbohydrate kinase [Trueperella sp.]|nr:PfkB family carbohydrate kinase [Trueperella sp.]